jgi:phospholipid/cholesterol/gamma-HCH transport system substrate-binding protein
MRRTLSPFRRLPDTAVGAFMVVVIAIGSYLAYTKEIPWVSHDEVRAVFANAQSVRGDEPVRVAGVEIGQIVSVEHVQVDEESTSLAANTDEVSANEVPTEASMVTMRLNDDAPPIREDASFKLRPRLFLEGNYFVDVTPGSPGGEEIGDDHVFPLNQTSSSVNLDQIFTTLQADVRRDLQVFLREFGNAMIDHGGAEGLRELNRTAGPAGRFTSRFNQAFLGTREGDLRGTLRGFNRVFRGLSRNEAALKGFVTNLRIFSGSFAAEDEALGRAVEQLPRTLRAAGPAYDNLNTSLPQLRAFAREALPGVRSSPEALREATPFIGQVRRLVSRRELRGLLAELRPTVPHLARLAKGNTQFLKQSRALSSCFNEVIIPWSHSTVEPVDPAGQYPHTPDGRTFEMTGYSLSGINGENRSADGNGHYIRTLGGSGSNLVRVPPGDGLRDNVFALTPFPLLGAMPRIGDSARTPFRPDEPCEQQEPPNLQAGIAPPPPQEPVPSSAMGLDALNGPGAAKLREQIEIINGLQRVAGLRADGDDEQADRVVKRAQRALARLGASGGELAAIEEGF